MTTRTKGLTRGARASIYRDGHELVMAVNVPEAGAFTLRTLPPGQYVARDSCGGEQAFTVSVSTEHATLLEGDTIGVTGEAGVSGSADSPTSLVGPGGGVFTHPDQVAPGETITGMTKRVDGEMPHEGDLTIEDAERPMQRPRDPGAEERVPGGAGAALEQDAPIRSVDEVMAAARLRGRARDRLDGMTGAELDALSDKEFTELERDADLETPAGEETPKTVKPDEQGPEPLESTLPPEGYGASSTATPTPLEGRREGDPQPQLGRAPDA